MLLRLSFFAPRPPLARVQAAGGHLGCMELRKEKREGDESAFVAIALRSLVIDQTDPIASRSINGLSRARRNARDSFSPGVNDFLETSNPYRFSITRTRGK